MNQSEAFHGLLDGSGPILTAPELSEIKDRYHIVLVKGFLGDLLPKRFDSYFFDQMRWMSTQNIGYSRLEPECGFGTQKLVQNNASAIARTLRDLHQKHSPKQLLIVSHSKGGIDTLETLLHCPELTNREITGWIALQAPFWGTPVANWATENRVLNPMIEKLLERFFNGDPKVAASMTTNARNDYMLRHQHAIADLCGQLNLLNFATTSLSGDPSVFRLLRFAIDKIAKLSNDGLLPTQSEILRPETDACCPFIISRHIDHIDPVLPIKPNRPAEAAAQMHSRRNQIFGSLLKVWMNNRKDR